MNAAHLENNEWMLPYSYTFSAYQQSLDFLTEMEPSLLPELRSKYVISTMENSRV